MAEKRSRCARLTNPSSVGTVRQLIDALSLTLEKLIKQGGQQHYILRAADDQEEGDVCFIER